MTDKRFVSVQENSYLLGAFFYQAERGLLYSPENGKESFTQIAEWLNMAAGIVEVVMDSGRYDDLSCYCGHSMDYIRDISDNYAQFSKQLSIFQFIWNSFELFVKSIFTKSKYGNSKSRYICNEFVCLLDEQYLVSGYIDVINKLYAMVLENERFKRLWKIIEVKQCHIYGSGLFVVNKIRNMFVHGSLCIPSPEIHTGVVSLDDKLIDVSSRIVLLTIQIIAQYVFRDESFDVWVPNEEYYYCREVDMHKYLREMHLRKICHREDQYKLL